MGAPMKKLFAFLLYIPTAFTFISCSAYQSEGRKFLEDEGIEFANRGQSLLASQACRTSPDLSVSSFEPWPTSLPVESTYQTWIRPHDDGSILLRITRSHSDLSTSFCDTQYESLNDLKADETFAVYGSIYALKELSLRH